MLGESEGFFDGLVDSYLISQDSYHIVYDHGVEDVVPYDQMQGLVRGTNELLQAAKSVGDVPRTDQLPQAAGSGLDVRGMTVLQIKEKLRERGLAVSGNKDVLVRRLEDATMDKETCKKAAGMQDEIISPWSFIETVCECVSEC